MSKLKIAVYTMAKNEEKHVKRFCDTTADADVVVVTDTGSTDDTIALLQARGVHVHSAGIMPWRFDLATNVALCNVPADVDVCVKLDMDEVLWAPDGKSWRDAIESAWLVGITTQMQYQYVWSWQVQGEVPGVQFTTGNIHARAGFVWKHPGHAALTYTQGAALTVTTNALQIHHYPVGKSRPAYLPLLELAVAENECPRTLCYLGREYVSAKLYDKAIAVLTKYLEHRQSRWKAERAEAMRLLGSCFMIQQQHQAIRWLVQATAEYPTAREPWYSLMEYMLFVRDWAGAVWAGTRCLSIENRDSGYVTQSAAAWSALPYIRVATAYQKLNNVREAMRTMQAGLAVYPNDPELRKHTKQAETVT